MFLKNLTDEKRIFIITSAIFASFLLMFSGYANNSSGLVVGKCYKYIKDFTYVNGAEICPVNYKSEKIEVISPTSYPKLVNDKINFINRNGYRDSAVFGYLVAPIFLGLTQLPLLFVGIYLRKKNVISGKGSLFYKNILFYLFLFSMSFSLSSTISFLFL